MTAVMVVLFCWHPLLSVAQGPAPALVGYWQNWNDGNAPYFPLTETDSRYNMVDISFAIPETRTDYNMKFSPDRGTQAAFISQVRTLQGQGTKVLISIGGANSHVSLDNNTERDIFISSMGTIIETYGFDGLDDFSEGNDLLVFPNPADDFVKISMKEHLTSPVNFHIYNSLGAVVFSGIFTAGDETINISGWTKGVYCVRLNGHLQKIIKE